MKMAFLSARLGVAVYIEAREVKYALLFRCCSLLLKLTKLEKMGQGRTQLSLADQSKMHLVSLNFLNPEFYLEDFVAHVRLPSWVCISVKEAGTRAQAARLIFFLLRCRSIRSFGSTAAIFQFFATHTMESVRTSK